MEVAAIGEQMNSYERSYKILDIQHRLDLMKIPVRSFARRKRTFR